jgi:hypothetical protein
VVAVEDGAADIVLASTTEADQEILERALENDKEAGRVNVFEHGSLNDFSSLEDGKVKELANEHPRSSRHRYEKQLAAAEKEMAQLAIPEDPPKTVEATAKETESRLQELERRTSAPIEPQPATATQADIDNLVEQRVSFREHEGRLAAAMQDPGFREAMGQIDLNNVNIVFNPQVATVIASQINSPVVTWFLASKPQLAQEISSMPVPRAIAEISKLSSWLQVQMQQPQNAAPGHRTATEPTPRPIKPVGGSSTPQSHGYVAPDQMDYQSYKAWRAKTGTRGR